MEISNLPEECISHIISFTSPRDACRSAAVSPLFRSASNSHVVWEKFLPPDYNGLIAQRMRLDSELSFNSMPKKALYFYLCDNPILIDNGIMSFRLDKESGKKCFMVASRALSIIWGDTPDYWTWISLTDSRFSEVAKLRWVCWLDISGKVETKILSGDTSYGVYFVYKLEERRYGFDRRTVQLRVNFEGHESGDKRGVYLDPSKNVTPLPRERGDGWMEIEVGEFFNESGEDGSILCGLKEVDDYNSKTGLIVEGIEFRPKGGA